MAHPLRSKFLLLLSACALLAVLSILTGSAHLNWKELISEQYSSIFLLRLWRVLIAATAGSGLAVSGIILQSILKNPLAEPYLLGTSSGAGLGSVIAAILGLSAAFLPAFAFIGALASSIIVFRLSREGGRIPAQALILTGVIVSIALSGMIVFLVSSSSNEALHGLMWWLWGSLQVYDIRLLLAAAAVVAGCIIISYVFAQDLNAMSLGEEQAVHLGIDTEKVKMILFFVSALMTASLVSICGIIGFVGLIVPHATRLWVGPNHKILIPVACLAAGGFMIACDLVSRRFFAPTEIPIGIVTAIIGSPVFLLLFKAKQKV